MDSPELQWREYYHSCASQRERGGCLHRIHLQPQREVDNRSRFALRLRLLLQEAPRNTSCPHQVEHHPDHRIAWFGRFGTPPYRHRNRQYRHYGNRSHAQSRLQQNRPYGARSDRRRLTLAEHFDLCAKRYDNQRGLLLHQDFQHRSCRSGGKSVDDRCL